MRFLYLAHDLSDSTVFKRANMFIVGGVTLDVAGFIRLGKVCNEANNWLSLGETEDGKFMKRILLSFKAIIHHKKLFKTKEMDAIICRNLETLIIGAFLKTFVKKDINLVYEILDIHRILIGSGAKSSIVRKLERFCINCTDGIITSSPRFFTEYIKKIQRIEKPVLLIENKVFPQQAIKHLEDIPNKTDNTTLNIGWFGILRCVKSFDILYDIAKNNRGKVNIILRGKPSREVLDLIDKMPIIPNFHFMGAYKAPEDLELIYSEIDIIWSIDFYEEGANSKWLLPNRLYEGCALNCIPLADEETMTGQYLNKIDVGITISPVNISTIEALISSLSATEIETLKAKIRNLPHEVFIASNEECNSIVNWINSNDRQTAI